METPKEYYYTYYSYEEWGRGYIGSRGCNCLPENDVNYFGSFKDKTFKPTQKIILKDDYATRDDAYADEIILQQFYKVVENPYFANRSYQTTTKFYYNRKGQKHPKISGDNHPSKREELRKNLSEKRKGDKNPMYGMAGEKNPFFGKRHTEETKNKIRLLSKNRKLTEEHKNKIKMSNINKKWWVNSDGTRKFQQECPGDEWKQGMVYK
jgi:hypothetical protein